MQSQSFCRSSLLSTLHVKSQWESLLTNLIPLSHFPSRWIICQLEFRLICCVFVIAKELVLYGCQIRLLFVFSDYSCLQTWERLSDLSSVDCHSYIFLKVWRIRCPHSWSWKTVKQEIKETCRTSRWLPILQNYYFWQLNNESLFHFRLLFWLSVNVTLFFNDSKARLRWGCRSKQWLILKEDNELWNVRFQLNPFFSKCLIQVYSDEHDTCLVMSVRCDHLKTSFDCIPLFQDLFLSGIMSGIKQTSPSWSNRDSFHWTTLFLFTNNYSRPRKTRFWCEKGCDLGMNEGADQRSFSESLNTSLFLLLEMVWWFSSQASLLDLQCLKSLASKTAKIASYEKRGVRVKEHDS